MKTHNRLGNNSNNVISAIDIVIIDLEKIKEKINNNKTVLAQFVQDTLDIKFNRLLQLLKERENKFLNGVVHDKNI